MSLDTFPRVVTALCLLLSLGAPLAAQESIDQAFREIETTLEGLGREREPNARAQLLETLFERCDRFLSRHLEAATPQQVEQAGGYWLELSIRKEVAPELVLAQIARLRAQLDPLPPRLARACQIVAAKIRLTRGQPAPGFAAETLQGEELRLSDLQGKYVLLDFWASWCQPCIVLGQGRLRPLHERYGDGLAVLGVGSKRRGETPAKQERAASLAGLHWSKVFDAEGTINQSYGVTSLPYLCLIDPEGKLVVLGPGRDVIDEIESLLNDRLGREEGQEGVQEGQ